MPFPRTLADIKVVQQALHDYQSRHYGHVLAVGAAAYVYKQSFALPGSGAMNVLLGAIFGLWLGFPAACLLTAIGSSFAFLISAYVLEPIVLRLFPIKIAQLKAAVAKDAGTDLLITMTGLRVFPLTPQWFVNMASPLIHVPLTTHFLSVLVGVAPYVLVFDESQWVLCKQQTVPITDTSLLLVAADLFFTSCRPLPATLTHYHLPDS